LVDSYTCCTLSDVSDLGKTLNHDTFVSQLVAHSVKVGWVWEAVVGSASVGVCLVVDAVPNDAVVTSAHYAVAHCKSKLALKSLNK
jgi:hypothetical protein